MKALQQVSVGIRSSKLSIAQTEQALERLSDLLPSIGFDLVPMDSPGDRDKETDLRISSPDFFTRDLDEAVIEGSIDCALHSAKDLPEKLPNAIDFLYLPWIEDPRDVLVFPQDQELPSKPRIGVSSSRREEYCRERFPDSPLLSIRGNIDDRIRQLDAGKYDMLIMAAAGLKRLGLETRISEYISLDDLRPPDGQGKLAVCFKKGNPLFTMLRKFFVKPVIFAGAGIGSIQNSTMGTVDALQKCDICFYDCLCPQELLDFLPDYAEKISVGKRSGAHSQTQEEINFMLIDAARRNKSVVRLKGGDPGLLGRLAEEVACMDEYELPYEVFPGISSVTVATTGTGMLLTRRELSRGFYVSTPRQAGSKGIVPLSKKEKDLLPQVFFMAASEVEEITKHLLNENYSSDMPVSVIFNAGYQDEVIVSGTVDTIAGKLPETSMPGIIIAGAVADKSFIYKQHGILSGHKILFTGSKTLLNEATSVAKTFGAKLINQPMIKLETLPDIDEKIIRSLFADWIIITSPSSAKIFFDVLFRNKIDLRRLPKLAVCGASTAKIVSEHGIIPDCCPLADFGADSLYEELKGMLNKSDRIVRLCSDIAPSILKDRIKRIAPDTVDVQIYRNQEQIYKERTEADTVLFCSPSAVQGYRHNFGPDALSGKRVCVIGGPTAKLLKELYPEVEPLWGKERNVTAMITALAVNKVNDELENIQR